MATAKLSRQITFGRGLRETTTEIPSWWKDDALYELSITEYCGVYVLANPNYRPCAWRDGKWNPIRFDMITEEPILN